MRVWAEISLSRLRGNYRKIKQRVGPDVSIMGVLKADAYGHGAPDVARVLMAEGAAWLGVAGTEEGQALRTAGITAPIMLLSGYLHGDEDILARHKLVPAVYEAAQLEALEQRALPYHVKVDTGMGRLGFSEKDICFGPHMQGLMTHLACADLPDDPRARQQTDEQITRFKALLPSFFTHHSSLFIHLANSAALATRTDCWGNLVRPGLALYGYLSCRDGLGLEPVLSLKTHILSLRDVPAGTPLGYGGRYVTKEASRIACAGAGYADGVSRALTNRGAALVRGHRVPMVGAVSMDLTLLDVTAAPGVATGDTVTLIGEDGGERILVPEIAAWLGTIPYEVLCHIGKRVPRVYVE